MVKKVTNYNSVGIMAVLLFLSGVLFTNNLRADDGINCKVMTIEATNDGSGIAHSLKGYATIFAQKPFSAFNSFKLIGEEIYKLKLSTPLELSLPDQLSGTLAYKGKTANSLKLTLELAKSQNPPIVIEGKAGNGIPFIAAGFKSPGGRWILAVKCNE